VKDPNADRLPPLGERTPGRPSRAARGTPWYRRAPIAALAGVAVGMLLGVGLAVVTDDDPEPATVGAGDSTTTTVPRRTTTTVATLPPECADAIRTAEQSLSLLDQALRTARRFDVGEFERMLPELQEVRRGLTDRVRACVERA
jgi:hypothetical protein